MYHDTIAAIATAPGTGGVGIVRISGPDATNVSDRLFRRAHGVKGGRPLPPRRLVLGHIVDPETGTTIDEALAVRMAAGGSYTREEVVELHCHGGAVVTREVLRACLRAGARQADAGEFTLRAFINGRLDLAQAEAVLGVVGARTRESLDLAVRGLRGRLSAELRPARDKLVDVLAYLDASADFPDDELPPIDVRGALEAAAACLEAVSRRAATGLLFREGLTIAIVGRPNVGKSSLLNALLRHERAIVTPEAGTTRDVIAEAISLHGIPATLLDTAGIRESADTIERLGIARSHEALRGAPAAIFVLDATASETPDDLELGELLARRLGPAPQAAMNLVVALNKADQFDGVPPIPPRIRALLPSVAMVAVSARDGMGIPALEEALYQELTGGAADSSTMDPALATVRQHEAIARARDDTQRALTALDAGIPPDIVATDARAALIALGEVTGETASEAVLAAIFARFCIGK